MPDPEPTLSSPATEADGVAFGWRAHEAVQAWTASVDSKASVALIVEVAVTAAATKELISGGGELHHAIGLHLATAITACTLLVLAVAGALAVIAPRLARRRNARLDSKGLIYFGHLKDQTADQIAERLTNMTPDRERRELAAQLQITAEKAWNKHVALQASLALFAFGTALLVIAFVAF
jgi:hypothetical protein